MTALHGLLIYCLASQKGEDHPDGLVLFGGSKQGGLGREFGGVGLSQSVEHQAINLETISE